MKGPVPRVFLGELEVYVKSFDSDYRGPAVRDVPGVVVAPDRVRAPLM